jgi:hypothetical protein
MRPLSKRLAIACVVLAGLVFGVTQAVGSSASTPAEPGELETTQPVAPNPFASYQQPTGPELSDGAVREVALKAAAVAGDASPSSITAISTTYAAAVGALDPGATQSSPSSAGEAEYRQSTVVVVVLHGQFVLNVSTPAKRPEPSGPVLSLVIDAHTGRIDVRGVEESEPPGLSSLGAARSLG